MYIIGIEELHESEIGFEMLYCKRVEVSSRLPSKVSLQYTDGKVILHRDPNSPKADYKNLWNGIGINFRLHHKLKVPIELMKKVGWSRNEDLIIEDIDEDTASVRADE